MKKLNFAELLENSLKDEGKISNAYSVFHNYSINNMLFAMKQMEAMKIEIAPIGTFNKFKSLGLKIKKGATAISLLVPATKKYTKEEDGEEIEKTITYFNIKKGWFSMSQTNADEKQKKEMMQTNVNFDLNKALEELKIKIIPFSHVNGNCMGFARGREIAINPVNPLKHKTSFHEMGHILLGHTAAGEMNDSTNLPRDIKELEAESVAYLCISALDLEGAKESRGYIQNWFNSDKYPEKSARRVMKVADQILKAGAVK